MFINYLISSLCLAQVYTSSVLPQSLSDLCYDLICVGDVGFLLIKNPVDSVPSSCASVNSSHMLQAGVESNELHLLTLL